MGELLEDACGGFPFTLDETTVGATSGRAVGAGNGGAPGMVLKGTQATPEGPTVIVEVTGVSRGTNVVDVCPLSVKVETTSVWVVTIVEVIVNIANSEYVVGTNVRVTVEPPSRVSVTTSASEVRRPGLPDSVGMGLAWLGSVPLGQLKNAGCVG